MFAKVKAFSKINLLLEVLGKRSDGYHDVQMIMQLVRLWDNVRIEESTINRVYVDSPFVPNNRTNLAIKAAECLQSRYHLPPVNININKLIPVSAGMAGGSADAAAVLLGMRALFAPNIPMAELLEIGASLGSDIPFCMEGPTALAYGRGEKVRALATLPKFYIVFIKADFGVPTARVYQNFIKSKNHKINLEEYLEAVEKKDLTYILSNLSNDLETTTFSLYPRVEQTKKDLQRLGADYVLMSGSGPTVFAAFKTAEEAYQFYLKARQNHKLVYLTSTVDDKDLEGRVTLTNIQ